MVEKVSPSHSAIFHEIVVFQAHYILDPNDLSNVPMLVKDERPPRDCEELQDEPSTQLRSGIYNIQPLSYKAPFPVYCDFATSGGWTVIQRRVDGSVDFNRGWDDYKKGFGNLETSFWLGNDKISALTMQKRYQLHVELTASYGPQHYALYNHFSVSNEYNLYRLTVGSYSGNAGNSLSFHNNMYFSTKDADHDRWSGDCAAGEYVGGWWYNACYDSNLHGHYDSGHIYWQHHPYGSGIRMTFTEMKIKA